MAEPRRVGRYEVWGVFAQGGMATVHLGRIVGERGFARLVAVKCLRADRAGTAYYARAFEDEARLTARIRHPNVVATLDVIEDEGRPVLVMEYVEGVSLARLLEAGALDEPQAARVLADVLKGLHAAHEAKDESGKSLGIVHRDVSPQNVLVGVDGLARLADFGVAKAARRSEQTATGAIKGKPIYMAPEHLRGLPLTRQADVYSAGIVLLEAVTGARPPTGDDGDAEMAAWIADALARTSAPLAEVVRAATQKDPRARYGSAAEMAEALLAACTPCAAEELAREVESRAGEELDERAELVRRIETAPATTGSAAPPPPRVAPGRSSRKTAALVGGILGVGVVIAGVWLVGGRLGVGGVKPSVSVSVSASVGAGTGAGTGTGTGTGTGMSTSTSASTSTSTSTSTSKARKMDCNPPFTVDGNGRKHYRVECLPR